MKRCNAPQCRLGRVTELLQTMPSENRKSLRGASARQSAKAVYFSVASARLPPGLPELALEFAPTQMAQWFSFAWPPPWMIAARDLQAFRIETAFQWLRLHSRGTPRPHSF